MTLVTHLVVHSVWGGGIRGPLDDTRLSLLAAEFQRALVSPEGVEGIGGLVGVFHPLTEAAHAIGDGVAFSVLAHSGKHSDALK